MCKEIQFFFFARDVNKRMVEITGDTLNVVQEWGWRSLVLFVWLEEERFLFYNTYRMYYS